MAPAKAAKIIKKELIGSVWARQNTMRRATVNLAPDEMPRTNGPAMGLWKKSLQKIAGKSQCTSQYHGSHRSGKSNLKDNILIYRLGRATGYNMQNILKRYHDASDADITGQKYQDEKNQYAICDWKTIVFGIHVSPLDISYARTCTGACPCTNICHCTSACPCTNICHCTSACYCIGFSGYITVNGTDR